MHSLVRGSMTMLARDFSVSRSPADVLYMGVQATRTSHASDKNWKKRKKKPTQISRIWSNSEHLPHRGFFSAAIARIWIDALFVCPYDWLLHYIRAPFLNLHSIESMCVRTEIDIYHFLRCCLWPFFVAQIAHCEVVNGLHARHEPNWTEKKTEK